MTIKAELYDWSWDGREGFYNFDVRITRPGTECIITGFKGPDECFPDKDGLKITVKRNGKKKAVRFDPVRFQRLFDHVIEQTQCLEY